MNHRTHSLGIAVTLGCLQAARAAGNAAAYLFTSFRGNGDGHHLAYSHDAHDWTELKRVFLTPSVGSKLMRDPHILRGPDGLYHMVWTSGWKARMEFNEDGTIKPMDPLVSPFAPDAKGEPIPAQ